VALPAVAALAAAVDSVGSPTPAHLAQAAGLIERLPPALREKTRDPSSARAVVCALLLDADPAVRARQLQALAEAGDAPLAAEVEVILPLAAGCPPEARLPLLDMAVPALRRMSAPQWRVFRAVVQSLVDADARLSAFEFALHHLLVRHLAPSFEKADPPPTQYYSLKGLAHECSLVLSALAHRGPEPAAAFAAGAAALPGVEARLKAEPECGLQDLGFALAALDGAAPPRKRQFLSACAAVIAHDQKVALEEGELLRAIADALRCPMPPLLSPTS
jgi:hypothetical protein